VHLALILLVSCVPTANDDDDSEPAATYPTDGPAFERVDVLLEPSRGGGIAVQDLDGDGLPELFVADFGGSRLHRNQGGFAFEPWPSEPWLKGAEIFDHWGATFADLDNDGDSDLLIHQAGPDSVWLQDDGAFQPGPALPALGVTFSMALADFDADGILDLYSTTHVGLNGDGVPTGEQGDDGLLRGLGDGSFEDVSAYLPANAGAGRGFCGRWSDWDHDGDIDLYLVNERPPGDQSNHLLLNEGADGDGWRFSLADASCFCDISLAGMGQAIGDYDRDGWQDLYMTNTSFAGAGPAPDVGNGEVLLRNTGDAVFVDASLTTGARIGRLSDGERTISWGAEFLDVDNDAWMDLYVAYGPFVEDPDSPQPNALARNTGGSFELWEDSGADHDGEGRAVVPVDLNGDGCMDLVVGQIAGPTLLFANRCVGGPGRWIQLELQGTSANRDAVGAVARVTAGGVTQRQEVFAGAVHSSPWKVLHFGLAGADGVDRVDIDWPDGSASTVQDLATNRRHRLVQP
jgi:enediyne biosynthesis protein E4